MIALRIISTVFVGISFITSMLKHLASAEYDTSQIVGFVAYSISWRVLVLITLWVI